MDPIDVVPLLGAAVIVLGLLCVGLGVWVRSLRLRVGELLAQQDADTKAIVGHLRETESLKVQREDMLAEITASARASQQKDRQLDRAEKDIEELEAKLAEQAAILAKAYVHGEKGRLEKYAGRVG